MSGSSPSPIQVHKYALFYGQRDRIWLPFKNIVFFFKVNRISELKAILGIIYWAMFLKLQHTQSSLTDLQLVRRMVWGPSCETCYRNAESQAPSRHIESEVLVTYLCPTLCDPMDCSLPDSSVQGVLQERIPEWVAIPFSKGSSQPRDQTRVSCSAGSFFTVWATREAILSVFISWRSPGNSYAFWSLRSSPSSQSYGFSSSHLWRVGQ